MRGRGYWREPGGESVAAETAYDTWGSKAFDILTGVARSYHAVIEYGTLAQEAQVASGVHTSVPFRYWIGSVLRRVVDRCHDKGIPPLTSLVVHSTDGKVGVGYSAVLEAAGDPPVEDELAREHHAAAARLECYRHFGAPLPPGAVCQHWPLAFAPLLSGAVSVWPRRYRSAPTALSSFPRRASATRAATAAPPPDPASASSSKEDEGCAGESSKADQPPRGPLICCDQRGAGSGGDGGDPFG